MERRKSRPPFKTVHADFPHTAYRVGSRIAALRGLPERSLGITHQRLQRVPADDLPYRNLLRAVARLEQSRSPEDVVRVVKALPRWLPNRGADELRRAFVDWIRQIAGVARRQHTMKGGRLAPVDGQVVLVLLADRLPCGQAFVHGQGQNPPRHLPFTQPLR